MRTVALIALALGSIAAAAAGDVKDAGPVVGGFHEVVISVGDLARAEAFYHEVAGWEVLHRGGGDPRWIGVWDLDAETRFDEVLLANPGDDHGFLRLVRFHGVEQVHIRSSARVWDSGGIFDFNVRVPDAWRKFEECRERGWHGYSDPVEFRFGRFVVREVLVRGHDEVVIAMIQRVEPPLDEGWNLGEFSRVFNSTQIVRDLDRELAFYRDKLGFKTYLEHQGPSKEAGPNVLGLPHDQAAEIPRRVAIVSPDGKNDGSVELLQFVGLEGADFSDRAVPPNRGILLLRFPVRGLSEYHRLLTERGVAIAAGPATTRMDPIGKVRVFAVRSPGGAWLEFYEAIPESGPAAP